MLSLFYVLTLL